METIETSRLRAQLLREVRELSRKKRRLQEDIIAIDKFIERRMKRIEVLKPDTPRQRTMLVCSCRIARRWIIDKNT
jgi:hypothetical protein